MRSGGAGDRAWRCAGCHKRGEYNGGGGFCLYQHGSYGYSGGEPERDRADESRYNKKQVLCYIAETGSGSDEDFAAVRPDQKGKVFHGGYIPREADQIRRDEAEV